MGCTYDILTIVNEQIDVELLPEILKVGILIEGIKKIQNGLEAKFVLILKGKNKIRNLTVIGKFLNEKRMCEYLTAL